VLEGQLLQVSSRVLVGRLDSLGAEDRLVAHLASLPLVSLELHLVDRLVSSRLLVSKVALLDKVVASNLLDSVDRSSVVGVGTKITLHAYKCLMSPLKRDGRSKSP